MEFRNEQRPSGRVGKVSIIRWGFSAGCPT